MRKKKFEIDIISVLLMSLKLHRMDNVQIWIGRDKIERWESIKYKCHLNQETQLMNLQERKLNSTT